MEDPLKATEPMAHAVPCGGNPQHSGCGEGFNIIVQYLPPHVVSAETLHQVFGRYGRILAAKVIVSPQDPNKSKGYGFVCFSTRSAAENAIMTMDGLKWSTKRLKVKFAERPPVSAIESLPAMGGPNPEADTQEPTSNLYVTGLPANWRNDELKQHFSEWGAVKSCIVLMDSRRNISKQTGLVEYESLEQAQRAQRHANNTTIHDCRIFVRFARGQQDKQDKNNKKKAAGEGAKKASQPERPVANAPAQSAPTGHEAQLQDAANFFMGPPAPSQPSQPPPATSQPAPQPQPVPQPKPTLASSSPYNYFFAEDEPEVPTRATPAHASPRTPSGTDGSFTQSPKSPQPQQAYPPAPQSEVSTAGAPANTSFNRQNTDASLKQNSSQFSQYRSTSSSTAAAQRTASFSELLPEGLLSAQNTDTFTSQNAATPNQYAGVNAAAQYFLGPEGARQQQQQQAPTTPSGGQHSQSHNPYGATSPYNYFFPDAKAPEAPSSQQQQQQAQPHQGRAATSAASANTMPMMPTQPSMGGYCPHCHTSGVSVCLYPLPYHRHDQNLAELFMYKQFSPYGAVTHMSCPGNGCGYATFRHMEDAQTAVRMLNGTYSVEGAKLTVAHMKCCAQQGCYC